MKTEFKLGQLVSVHGVLATISDIQNYGGELDFLLAPVSDGADFCACGEEDCHGSAWFRASELDSPLMTQIYKCKAG